MAFIEVVDRVSELLRHRGRISYRVLKIEFDLTDEHLEALKEELIAAKEVAIDEDGKVLVWQGHGGIPQTPNFAPQTPNSANPRPPSSYTPPHLAERICAEQAALAARGATDDERKTITALFADLKGSTALIEGLDPEDARAIIDPALQLMMDAVHRYEGYVAQALGDGILALFGAPIAHEDHPQRALYAALRMQEEMRRYSDQVRLRQGAPLALRVGLNTGEVVVRSIRKDDLHTDYVPVGHATNLAARMEQMATPGSILITEYTRKLVEGYFELKALGAAQIKGVEEPLSVYEVLGAGPLRTRLQVSARRGLTRFVGRQSELEQMRRALEQAQAGRGQITGLMGEPGLGKSRLFYEFKLTSQSGCLVLEAFSVSHGKASPYLPVLELLKAYFEITPEDEERKRREKVTGKVLTLDRTLEDILPYLFALLGIADSQASLQHMDAQIRRRRTWEALKKLFLRESLNQPLMLIFEDLHWIDTETQGFLDTLSESVASARILLLVNYRPEYRHEWGQKTYYTQLRLAPLGKAEAEEFLEALLGTTVGARPAAPLQDLKHLILAKTEGTPFFMEEVVQTLMEEGVLSREAGVGWVAPHPTTALHLPTTVQGVLAARIDRLAADEKALLQQFAVIGREFSLSLAKQVVSQPEDELYRLLSSLQHKEFLYEQPAFPEPDYIFKHALTQEVAYGTVLQERRKALHQRTAQAIEELYDTNLDEHYSDLAHHYSRSESTAKAVQYLHLAGQQAAQRAAYADAVRSLTTALELLQTLPETAQRNQQELALQISLGAPLAITKGNAAPEVEVAYIRARELCQQGGETTQLFPVLWGLAYVYVMRSEYKTALELAQQCLALAESTQDPAFLLEAHYMMGVVLAGPGEFVPALEHFQQSIARYDPQQHHSLAFIYGQQDPGVICRVDAAQMLWELGYPDQALKMNREALTLARELSHPFSLVWALVIAAQLHYLNREGAATQEQAEAAITLCTEHGLSQWLVWGSIYRGCALVEQGRGEEGIAEIRQSLATYQSTGAEAGQVLFLTLLAEAYGRTGQAEEGLAVLAEAQIEMNKTEQLWSEAMLHQLKGELTLQSRPQSPESRVKEAEEYFLKTLEIARRRQAKSWELRAATHLARLWQQQGRTTEAYRLLSNTYGWFTEGFDTKDLQEAQALLDSLR